MSELLLELYSGEIPALMQQKAAIEYKNIFTKYFIDNAINFDQINVYVGPRRLTIHTTGMATKLTASTKALKGPKISASQEAINGFCRSNNIISTDLIRTKIKNVELYVYEQKTPKRNTKDILLDSLHIPISQYVWPKSMYWGEHKIKWIRPLQNILCIFDTQTIAFKYGSLIANNQCYGHKFMSTEIHEVSTFTEYKKILEDNFVILDAIDRKKYIQTELKKTAKKLDLIIKEDAALLEEVLGLVEYPQVLIGTIDKQFLSMPNEILVNAMRTHQKYFSLFDKDANLAPYFVCVSNIISTDTDIVVSGNEKVLSARLADALYFYNQDLKTSLQEKAQRLEKVIFHAKIGNVREKTLRLVEIVKFIDPSNKHAVQAALLCKSDIVSEIVNEFPSLQGIMGYYYAQAESLDSEVAIAIGDHYKPQGPNDHCPSNTAAILALADKIDNLCGLILAGEKASGSKDPFALRRQALGIIRIILENKLTINLLDLVKFVINQYKDILVIKNELKQQIINFLEERLKYFFKDQYAVTVIASVLDLKIESNLIAVQSKLHAIKEFLTSEDADDLLIVYKRMSNMLRTTILEGKIDESIFISEHEINLFSIINICNSKIMELIATKNYTKSLQLLASIREPISTFFDNVMVKDKDIMIANNRMLLLANVKQVFDKIANFDRLE